jgi:hypothetical protein
MILAENSTNRSGTSSRMSLGRNNYQEIVFRTKASGSRWLLPDAKASGSRWLLPDAFSVLQSYGAQSLSLIPDTAEKLQP